MVSCQECNASRRVAKGGVPWCTLCRSEKVEVIPYFMTEDVLPSVEAQTYIAEWQKAFKDQAPGTSTLRAKTRDALQHNGIKSGDTMMMAMLVGDKEYISTLTRSWNQQT